MRDLKDFSKSDNNKYMTPNNQRPVYLNLFKIRLPVMGTVSLFHRLSGVLLALATPLFVYLFELSLRGPESYAQALAWLERPWVKLLGTLLLWSLAHHLLAGVRFLLIDLDVGVEKSAARRSAWLVHGAAAVILILALPAIWS